MTSPEPAIRHFLDLADFSGPSLRGIIRRAELMRQKTGGAGLLQGKNLALIFEKPSTRTRVSFEVGMAQMGGHAVVLSANDMQLGRGETVADTARVLSRYVDAMMLRTAEHSKLLELAAHATVPVINGLTDWSHPVQIMADIMTYEQHRGPITGKRVAWIGDGNNVANSYIHAAMLFGFDLCLATPASLAPVPEIMAWADNQGSHTGGRITVTRDSAIAVQHADLVVTDTWVSMGQAGAEERHAILAPYQVDAALMRLAKPDALFMHCLPAHRGEEVTAAVIDGPQSVVFDEAENRLHVQKGILAWCFSR